ncbi:hypothetical protein COU23_02780, partial [Candidatus Kuenenbacteria bacterium CG10_big_fil_rev_8_21_14_0_10_36_11]
LKSGSTDPCAITSAPIFNDQYGFSSHCIGGVSLNANGSCVVNADCTNLANPGSEGVCSNWVGLCNEASSGCREYQDPQNPVGCNKSYVNNLYQKVCSNDISKRCTINSDCGSGQCNIINVPEKQICNYYYYKDVDECESGVGPSQGCVGFKDSLNPVLNVRSFKVCDNDNNKKFCSNDITEECVRDSDCKNNGLCNYYKATCDTDNDCNSGGRCRYVNTQ